MTKTCSVKKLVLMGLLLLIVAVGAATVSYTEAFASLPLEEHQDPPPDPDGGSGGGCTYCSTDACGCASPPPGCILFFSCQCDSFSCIRDCDFDC